MANHNTRKEERKARAEARRAELFESTHRWARMCGTKVRLVADQIRGLPINRALEVLKFSKKRGAYLLNKVVRSALANAEYQISDKKLDLDVDALFVKDAHVDEGPQLKRWMTRARGMAYPILRKTCHIHVGLSPSKEEGEADAGERPAAAKAKPEKPGKPEKAAGEKKGKKKAAAAGAAK